MTTDDDAHDLANDYLNARRPAIVSASEYAQQRVDLELAIAILVSTRHMLINTLRGEAMIFTALAEQLSDLGFSSEAESLRSTAARDLDLCVSLNRLLELDMTLAAKYGVDTESIK